MIWSTSDLRAALARGRWPWGATRGVTEAPAVTAEPQPVPVAEPPASRRPARRRRRKPTPMPRYTLAEMCAVLSALAEQQRQGVAAVSDVMGESHFAAHPAIVDGANAMARTGDVLAAVAGLLGTLKREAVAGGDVKDLLRRMP